MRFLPLETCKKLVEMGCKSESKCFIYSGRGRFDIPHFELEDFLGSHKQALVNCNTMLRNISTELKEVFWGMGILNSSDWQKSLVCTEDWVEDIKELVA